MKAVLTPNFAGIPPAPQKNSRWIVWREEMVPDKQGIPRPTKVPYRADGRGKADTSKRETWSTYSAAKAWYLGHTGTLGGVGYCRDGDDAFIDLDHFLRDIRPGDPLKGYEFEKHGRTFAEWDWAGKQPEEIYLALLAADAWIELSPSSYGAHAVVRSSSIVASFQRLVPGMEHAGVALYTANRYLTVTGTTLWAGNYERDNYQLLEQLALWVPGGAADKRSARVNGHRDGAAPAAAAPDPGAPGYVAPLSDTEVIRRICEDPFTRALWAGSDPGVPGDNSPSGLDAALCQKLAFWCRGDRDQIDRLFRESGLMRPKWEEREDYRERTIEFAVGITSTFWTPRAATAPPPPPARAKQAKTKTRAAAAAGDRSSPGASKTTADAPPPGPDDSTGTESAGEPPPPPPSDPPSDGDVPPGAWKGLLLRSEKGKPLCCLANADIVLRYAPQWEKAIVLDEFSNQIRTVRPTPLGEISSWNDTASTRCAIWMQKQGVPVTSAIVHEAVLAVASDHRIHPLREYLSSLRWDGEPRIDRWLVNYLGAAESPYTCLAGAWWLGQAVARAFHAGAQADYTLVLEGPQGQKKSQALRALAGGTEAGDSWFTDQISDFASKDSSIDLQGRWIVELGEFDRMAHKPSIIKAFLTRQSDHFRPPYGRFSLEFPRQCVFAATVNLDEYFADDTGNRRFWPVKCGEIDLDALRADRDQLWAEAVERFEHDNARRWPSSGEELASFGVEQAEREEVDVWYDRIADWVSNPRQHIVYPIGPVGELTSTAEAVTVADILTHAIPVESKNQTDAMKKRVVRTLRQLGWRHRRRRWIPPRK